MRVGVTRLHESVLTLNRNMSSDSVFWWIWGRRAEGAAGVLSSSQHHNISFFLTWCSGRRTKAATDREQG